MSLTPLFPGSGGGGAAASAQAPLVGRRMAIIGDSREAAFNVVTGGSGETRIQARNYLSWAAFFLNGRVVYNQAYVWGFTGQGSAYLLSQYADTVGKNYANFDMLFIEGPTNDLDGTSNIFATGKAVANVSAMANQALANGKFVILMAISPRSLWSGLTTQQIANAKQQLSAYNRWAQQYANATQGVVFVNDFQDMAQPSGDPLASPAVTGDSLHFNNLGAFVRGRRIAKALLPLLADVGPPQTTILDTYNATYNPRGNLIGSIASFAGATGTKGAFNGGAANVNSATSANPNGTIPTGWDVGKGEGNVANGLAVTVLPATSGYDGQPAKMVCAAAFPSGNAAIESFGVNAQFSQAFPTGAQVQAGVTLDAASVQNLVRFQFSLALFGTTYQQWICFEDGAGMPAMPLPDGRYLLLSPIATVAAGQSGGVMSLYAVFNASASNAGGTLQLSNPFVAQLSP